MKRIPKSIALNVDKVNKFWVVEIFWVDYYADSIWLSKD